MQRNPVFSDTLSTDCLQSYIGLYNLCWEIRRYDSFSETLSAFEFTNCMLQTGWMLPISLFFVSIRPCNFRVTNRKKFCPFASEKEIWHLTLQLSVTNSRKCCPFFSEMFLTFGFTDVALQTGGNAAHFSQKHYSTIYSEMIVLHTGRNAAPCCIKTSTFDFTNRVLQKWRIAACSLNITFSGHLDF